MATAERRRGRPPQLSKKQIVAAVSAGHNVDELTMRELASRLGVGHSALYRWVRNRDELFDLLGAEVVDRVLSDAGAVTGDWRADLRRIARAMHVRILAVPGYATHLTRPHPHDAHATDRLRSAVIDLFVAGGIGHEAARRSWYITVTGVIGWLAFQEQPHHLGASAPTFDTYLEVLVRGLPADD
ncbi:TetR family transcriptional regulator [Rudaeicoccus suwonensis]|uniref:TetR family transcriptional regulator n=1 Tax=Rudaeicoccus suwonensis TaxID=657409 RepID=A0A561E6S0_9MICO|nr:TetR family transcriptional regulator [Rudaeicoccus suwonensis]TWE11294.1 TetR family transcriptional regulator [Rudaeicoccus suwonensis]